MEPINSQANIQSMLQTIRAYQSNASKGMEEIAPRMDGQVQGTNSFSEAIKASLSSVNDLQNKADQTTDAYERGEGVPLTDVVLSMQKSSIAFEATLQVRNKVLKAYEDIMNMPV
jgi:flagellar hook-basal body complex protein FliE